ncbi:MAG: cell division topological specificity factor MinE [Caldiserica bacterium CG23_combo_of_CG06-09_8_20_14_all_35_60]|nr:cell division topological specificity factor MinE [Caldisericota bacterium]PIP49688.1 MAG: cell division topological specificity factor MinE [Caldiserica bacterium CG23_combo_of_CG06-09_8_20_14_all_35_60]
MNLFRTPKGTSAIAEERLKLILVQDRSLLPPAKFEQMKEDIVDIMSNYFDFNTADIVINIQRESKKTLLEAIIPLLSVKRKTR